MKTKSSLPRRTVIRRVDVKESSALAAFLGDIIEFVGQSSTPTLSEQIQPFKKVSKNNKRKATLKVPSLKLSKSQKRLK